MLSDKYVDPLVCQEKEILSASITITLLSEEEPRHHRLMFITQIGRQL